MDLLLLAHTNALNNIFGDYLKEVCFCIIIFYFFTCISTLIFVAKQSPYILYFHTFFDWYWGAFGLVL